MQSEQKQVSTRFDNVVMMFLAGVAVISICASVVLLIRDWPNTAAIATDADAVNAWGIAGTKGDFFGGHIAAGTAFASSLLFLIALMHQRRELDEQRRELELTRHEMFARRLHDAIALVQSLDLKMFEAERSEDKDMFEFVHSQKVTLMPYLQGLLRNDSLSHADKRLLAFALGDGETFDRLVRESDEEHKKHRTPTA